MKQYKTEAVVLDSTDIFDADRSYLLFTEGLGKVRARARGVRKPTSRLTGHLLPYLPAQVELIEGKGGLYVTQAQTVSERGREGAYPADSLLFSQQAGLVAEAINRFFIDQEPHPQIYAGLVYTLDRLHDVCQRGEATAARLIAAELLVKCLAELGYQPQVQRCVVTDLPVDESFVGWSSQLGGVLSAEGYAQVRDGARRIGHPRLIVALRLLLEPRFMAERLQMPAEVEEELVEALYDYLQTQIGQPLRALRTGAA